MTHTLPSRWISPPPPEEPVWDDPYDAYDEAIGYVRSPPWARDDDRLRHLVFVDGRLVDSWSDAVAGTRWAAHAARFDEQVRPPPPPAAPPRPAHEAALDWLVSLVGTRAALDDLDDSPAPEPRPVRLPVDGDPVHEAVTVHLASVVEELFEPEVGVVLEDALAHLWERDPGATLHRDPAQTAAGLCWVVGKANGLFGIGLPQVEVGRHLDLATSISGPGQAVARVLRGACLREGRAPRQLSGRLPGIEGFGDPRLLTSATRRLLIPWRDVALGEEAGERPSGVP